jgi:hypothetical protein
VRMRLRRGRYSRIAAQIARYAEDRDREAILPQSIGGSLLKATNAQRIRLASRRHLPRSMEDLKASDRATRDPNSPRYFQTPYSAQVFLIGGEPQVAREQQEARDVAPVTGPATTPDGSPPPDSDAPSQR